MFLRKSNICYIYYILTLHRICKNTVLIRENRSQREPALGKFYAGQIFTRFLIQRVLTIWNRTTRLVTLPNIASHSSLKQILSPRNHELKATISEAVAQRRSFKKCTESFSSKVTDLSQSVCS